MTPVGGKKRLDRRGAAEDHRDPSGTLASEMLKTWLRAIAVDMVRDAWMLSIWSKWSLWCLSMGRMWSVVGRLQEELGF